MGIPETEIINGWAPVAEDYDVEFAGSPEALRKNVLARCADGWIVQGGVAMACGACNKMSYAQAMVKPAPPLRVVR
jgi:hypothetical protein